MYRHFSASSFWLLEIIFLHAVLVLNFFFFLFEEKEYTFQSNWSTFLVLFDLFKAVYIFSSHRVDFGLGVLGWFKIWFCVHNDLHNCKFLFKSGQIEFGYKVEWISNHRICFKYLIQTIFKDIIICTASLLRDRLWETYLKSSPLKIDIYLSYS